MNISASPTTAGGVSHDLLANTIRFLVLDAVEQANSGHAGMPLGMADVANRPLQPIPEV